MVYSHFTIPETSSFVCLWAISIQGHHLATGKEKRFSNINYIDYIFCTIKNVKNLSGESFIERADWFTVSVNVRLQVSLRWERFCWAWDVCVWLYSPVLRLIMKYGCISRKLKFKSSLQVLRFSLVMDIFIHLKNNRCVIIVFNCLNAKHNFLFFYIYYYFLWDWPI